MRSRVRSMFCVLSPRQAVSYVLKVRFSHVSGLCVTVATFALSDVAVAMSLSRRYCLHLDVVIVTIFLHLFECSLIYLYWYRSLTNQSFVVTIQPIIAFDNSTICKWHSLDIRMLIWTVLIVNRWCIVSTSVMY